MEERGIKSDKAESLLLITNSEEDSSEQEKTLISVAVPVFLLISNLR